MNPHSCKAAPKMPRKGGYGDHQLAHPLGVPGGENETIPGSAPMEDSETFQTKAFSNTLEVEHRCLGG